MGVWRRVVLLVSELCLVTGCGRIDFDERGGDGGIVGGNGLTITATPPSINVGSRSQVQATGGIPPYTFRLEGQGTLSGTTFTAPTPPGSSVVHVDDSAGDTAMVTIPYQGQQLFLIAGQDGAGAIGTVLASTDGVTWTQIGALPAPRINGAAVVYNDTMFYLGGLDAVGGAQRTEVYSSKDGVTWALAGNLPANKSGINAIVHAGEMWVVGGVTSGSNTATSYHSSDGVTWTTAPAMFQTPRHEEDLVSRDGRLYLLGGHGNAGFLDDIQSTTDGSQWTTEASTLTFATDSPGAAVIGNLAIRVCGEACTNTETSTDVVTWTMAAPLPDGMRTGPSLVAFGGRMLVVGGRQTVLATTDGSSWTMFGNLPASRILAGVVQFTPP